MIKRKKLALFLTLTLLIQIMSNFQIVATGVIGTNGSIPSGGQPGPGGISMVPSFRVGLISETFNEPIDFSQENNVDEQIIAHYYNHMPALEKSIIFSPYNPSNPSKSVWLSPDRALLGWYEASSGDFNFIEDPDIMPFKHRQLNADDGEKIKTGIFSPQLVSAIESTSEFSLLAGGKWKEIGDKVDDRVNKSSQVWNFLLEHWDGTGKPIDDNIRLYTNYVNPKDAITEKQRLANRAGHLDLLMTIYYLSHPDQQKLYYDEIERYIRFEDQPTKPALVAIDTVVRVSAPHYTKDPNDRIFVPAGDYIMYAAGVTPENSFYKPLAPSFSELNSLTYKTDHTFQMMGNLIQRSIDQAPNRKRSTDLRGDAFRNNAFCWGFSGVVGDKYLLTDQDYPNWRNSSVTNGIMESLIFHGDARGFIIGSAGAAFPNEIIPTGGFEIRTNGSELVTIDREQPTILGENISVTINGKLTGDEEAKWIKAFDDLPEDSEYPKIKIKLSASNAVTVLADVDVTYSLKTSHPYKGNGNWVTTTEAELLKFLKRGSIDWNHLTSDFKVAHSNTYVFDYTADIQIQLKDQGKIITLVGIPDNKATKTFVIPPYIPEEYRRYISEPIVFSEIKQGSIYNEDFEAMAGTPTTRDLYFAVGGSEYIVDIVTKYYPDQEATRKYRSWYSGTSCEFKAGDTSPNKSVGGQSANMHGGGTYTKTWTGSIPNTASAVTASGSGDVTATCIAKPDTTAYEAAEKEAEAFAKLVNKTTVEHTAASDGVTRKFNSWGASVDPIPSPPTDTSASSSAWHTETTGSPPDVKTIRVADPTSATASPSGPGSYTITVTWSNPAHAICGPCCTHELPMVEDKWTQNISYDIQKIEKVNVWKIDRGFVDGMIRLLDTDEVTATVKQGDPNIFYNIASNETSQAGRLRYSLEPDQHDSVDWNEGVRTNKCNGMGNNGTSYSPNNGGHSNGWAKGILYTNPSYENTVDRHIANSDATDQDTVEWKQFDTRRETDNTATVISDFLILQTSSGDQSIIYFDKDSNTVHSQVNFDKVVNTVEEMWDNNSECASQMTTEDINIGSYNGEFYNRTTKYKGTGDNHRTTTVLDNDPANTISRPTRPTNLRIYESNLDIPDTTKNGEYITGNAKVFYRNILSKGSSSMYPSSYDADFGDTGIIRDAPYSSSHSKVNDIVIHNPVSAQYAVVLPVPDKFDQRTPSTQAIGGNLQKDTQEYITQLKNPHPKQNFIINGDAEDIANDGTIINWTSEVSDNTGVLFTRRTEPTWKIDGTGSFEIRVPPHSNRIAKYVTETVGQPNTAYTFSGKIGAHRCEGYFSIEALDSAGSVIGAWSSSKHINSGTVVTKTFSFTTPANTVKLRVNIVNGLSSGSSTADDYVFADNLVLTMDDGDTAEWIPLSYTVSQTITMTNPDYEPERTIANPDYIAPIDRPGEVKTFYYTGNYQTYTAPIAGTYTLEVWGAQGGGTPSNSSTGGRGGYAKGQLTLSKGETFYIYVGAKGGNSPSNSIDGYNSTNSNGGWNGGAPGSGSRGPGGGGRTDIRRSTNWSTEIIVAGGGGGSAGGGSPTSHSPYTRYSGQSGPTGWSGPYEYDTGGGGGGYYGGSSVAGDDPSWAYAGGNYTSGLTSTTSSYGVQSGSGMARITEPDIHIPGNGLPPTITLPEVGTPTITATTTVTKTESQPPDDWYETILVIIPANPNVTVPGSGSITPGNFLTLDYPFKVYFPNKGDFYGDGSYGLSRTTNQRGKGFVDDMDTTEWTTKKVAKFDYNVIYNGQMYPSGYEIPLAVNEEIYDFYLPLANKEAISARASFYSIANNGSIVDNSSHTNKARSSNRNAKHSAFKMYNIDIVGKIGNLIIEDTGDFRFSNLFKDPLFPTQWFIPNVVPRVALDQQHQFIGPSIDIRGDTVNASTDYLNTYGSLDFLEKAPLGFPLSPSINNIAALQKQPLRLGYPLFMDIQTVGNYYSNMQIISYYYQLNLSTGTLTPVDVYMKVDKEYKPINLFGAAVPGWDSTSVYNYQVKLDWEEESARRNYQSEEQTITEYVRDKTYNVDTAGNEVPIGMPMGKYHTYGNAQIMYPNERNRSYIGTSDTYGIERNPGDILPEYNYNQQAQRWHFTMKLPSSAIFVPHGSPITQSNIDLVTNNRSVIIAAADIKAIGDTYVLQYEHPNGNGSVTIAGTTHSLASIPYSVYAVYSSEKSSSDDLSTSGTH